MIQKNHLQFVAIARPCSVSWGSMTGNDRARTCAVCERQVFDLASMTAVEAEKLLDERSDRLCVRLCRAGNGQVVTADRRVQWRPDRRFLLRMSLATLAGWVGVMQPSRALAARRDGTLSGVITDPAGLVVPGAEVIVVNQSGRREFKTVSAADGRYSFSLAPGTYTVRVQLDGFVSFDVAGVRVIRGCNSVVNHQFDVGFIGELVRVPPPIPACRPQTKAANPNR